MAATAPSTVNVPGGNRPPAPTPQHAPRAQYVQLKANVHRKLLNRLNL